MLNHKDIFTRIYETGQWGDNGATSYKGSSGCGSTVEYNKESYAPFLRSFIQEKKIQTVIDCGCGDWRCGEIFYGNLPIKYTGIDTYSKIIESHKVNYPEHNWICMDFFNAKEEIPEGDLLILKDVIQHWKTQEIYTFLDYITQNNKFKYILIVNCSYQTIDDYDIPEDTEETYHSRPLTALLYPLKKYNPEIVFTYHTKEVSIITSK